MKIREFKNKFENEVYSEENNPYGIETIEKRDVDLWMIHQTIKTNKKLVQATWALASNL